MKTDTSKRDMREALRIHIEATRHLGSNKNFSEAVADLVARSASDYADLASRFRAEGEALIEASRIAKGRENPYKNKGDCYFCNAENVVVRPVLVGGIPLKRCLSCDTFG